MALVTPSTPSRSSGQASTTSAISSISPRRISADTAIQAQAHQHPCLQCELSGLRCSLLALTTVSKHTTKKHIKPLTACSRCVRKGEVVCILQPLRTAYSSISIKLENVEEFWAADFPNGVGGVDMERSVGEVVIRRAEELLCEEKDRKRIENWALPTRAEVRGGWKLHEESSN